MKLRPVLCVLFLLTLLGSCGVPAHSPASDVDSPNAQMKAEDVNSSGQNIAAPASEGAKSPNDIYPVDEGQASVQDSSAPPVVISYLDVAEDSKLAIITKSLNRDHHYAKLPVEAKTILKADPRIDEAENIYLLYGSKETYFSKLGPDGSVETKELDVYAVVDTLWVGEFLLICQQNANNDLLVVNKAFEAEAVPSVTCEGKWGLSAGKMDKALWFLSSEADGKTQISYHTYNPTNKESSEGKVELPFVRVDGNMDTDDPSKKSMLDVVAIDSENENVVLTYLAGNTDSGVSESWLEIYDPKQQKPLVSVKGGGVDRSFQFSGTAFYSIGSPGTGGYTMAYQISDLAKIQSFESYDTERYKGMLTWDWLATNGSHWYRMTNKDVLVYDQQGLLLSTYENTLSIPEGNIPGMLVRIALPFYMGE